MFDFITSFILQNYDLRFLINNKADSVCKQSINDTIADINSYSQMTVDLYLVANINDFSISVAMWSDHWHDAINLCLPGSITASYINIGSEGVWCFTNNLESIYATVSMDEDQNCIEYVRITDGNHTRIINVDWDVSTYTDEVENKNKGDMLLNYIAAILEKSSNDYALVKKKTFPKSLKDIKVSGRLVDFLFDDCCLIVEWDIYISGKHYAFTITAINGNASTTFKEII